MLGCYVVLVLSFALLTESQILDRCNVTPVPDFRPEGLYGKWYGVKILFPSSGTRSPITDIRWFIEPSDNGLSLTINGRMTRYPYNCISDHVMLTPIQGRLYGYYRWTSQDCKCLNPFTPENQDVISNGEAVIAFTDYDNTLVIHLCIRRSTFEPCERTAMVVSRRVYRADPVFTARLDRFISRRLCLDPRRFTLGNFSPYGLESCSVRQPRTRRRPVFIHIDD